MFGGNIPVYFVIFRNVMVMIQSASKISGKLKLFFLHIIPVCYKRCLFCYFYEHEESILNMLSIIQPNSLSIITLYIYIFLVI